jgi:uncharacterized protein YndB with AHSA1/START domain
MKGANVPEVETRQAEEVLTCEVRVEASPETFPYFTDPDLMVRWMGTSAKADARPGGPYRYDVQGKDGATGEFVELDPPRRVVFTWGWENEGLIPPGSSTDEVLLEPVGEAMVVTLLHRDLPAEHVPPHEHGWSHYLGRLAVAAPGGDAGPDVAPEDRR